MGRIRIRIRKKNILQVRNTAIQGAFFCIVNYKFQFTGIKKIFLSFCFLQSRLSPFLLPLSPIVHITFFLGSLKKYIFYT